MIAFSFRGGETMETLWFVIGFAVTTTVVIATEKVIEKNKN